MDVSASTFKNEYVVLYHISQQEYAFRRHNCCKEAGQVSFNTCSFGSIYEGDLGHHTASIDGRNDDIYTHEDFGKIFLRASKIDGDNIHPFTC